MSPERGSHSATSTGRGQISARATVVVVTPGAFFADTRQIITMIASTRPSLLVARRDDDAQPFLVGEQLDGHGVGRLGGEGDFSGRAGGSSLGHADDGDL